MVTPPANAPMAYRQTSGALVLAWLGLLLILFGLTAPSFCIEGGDCKFFTNALFNYHHFENDWREGIIQNYYAFQLAAVLPAIIVATRLRRRSALLIGSLAVLMAVGLTHEIYFSLASAFRLFKAELRWGWAVIWLGWAFISIGVSRLNEAYPIDPSEYKIYRWPNNTQVALAVVGLILFAFGGISPLMCVEDGKCAINGAGALFQSENFDNGLREGLAANSGGIIVIGLAILTYIAIQIPGVRTDSHNGALIAVTAAALSTIIVRSITFYALFDLSENIHFAWGWIPFWGGALLLVVAAWQKAESEPMTPVVSTEPIISESPLIPDSENMGNA